MENLTIKIKHVPWEESAYPLPKIILVDTPDPLCACCFLKLVKALEQNAAAIFFSRYRLLTTHFQYVMVEQEAETTVAGMKDLQSLAYSFHDPSVKRASGTVVNIATPPLGRIGPQQLTLTSPSNFPQP